MRDADEPTLAEGLLAAMIRTSHRRVVGAEERAARAEARVADLEAALRGLLDADEREARGDAFAWQAAHEHARKVLAT